MLIESSVHANAPSRDGGDRGVARGGAAPRAAAPAALAQVALITPSYRGDLERCALLFESIDAHVSSATRHYVIVHDEDVALFRRFEGNGRVVLPVSRFLPSWLRRVPLVRWRGRQYWWSLRGKPISGWHTQQLVKIQAVASLPEARFCLVDSDNVFFRDFDLSQFAAPHRAPMHRDPGGITLHRPRHIGWVRSAHALLGLPAPTIPADDFIDQIIVWDQETVRAMTARIEAVAGCGWIDALCRARDFSEYMIYGSYVANTQAALAGHAVTTASFCRTYWDSDRLGQEDILAMLRAATDREVALCVQSFGPTSLETIRSSLEAFVPRQGSSVAETGDP